MMVIFLYFFPMMFNMRYKHFDTPLLVSSNNENINGLATNRMYHLTFMFNTFMMMNLFNQINCRKLGA